MAYRLVIAFLLTFLFTHAGAQELTVVVKDRDKTPLSYVYVNIYAGDKEGMPRTTVFTDDNGIATVNVTKAPFTLEVVSMGYEAVVRKYEVFPTDTRIEVELIMKISSLQEVVVTGVANPTKLKDALSLYQIISKSQIQAQGAVTLNDVLKNQLNINVDNSDQILGSELQLQGMRGNKVKILIDGMPLGGREGGSIDLSQINLNNVERIEIVQGPMSVVYGTDALGGIINVITKKERKPWGFNAGAYYESLGKYNFDATGTYRVADRHQFTISGGRNFFDGYMPLDSLERAYIYNPKEQYLANFAYSYTAPSSFNLRLASDFVKEKVIDKNAAYISPFEAYAFDNYYRNTRNNTRLQLQGKLGKKGTWQMQNGYGLYYRIRNNYRKDLVTLEETLIQGQQDTSKFEDVNFRGNYTNSVKSVGYTVGYDVNLQHGNSQKIEGQKASMEDYAMYATVSVPLFDKKLTVQPALRASYNSNFNAPVIPSLNLLYSHSEDVQLRASYAKGFRAPTLKELYLSFVDANHEIMGNPDLKAEEGHHIQASASWQFYKERADFAKILVTSFYNDVQNQIILTQPDTLRPLFATYANFSRFRNTIGSIQADAQVSDFYVQLGYSVQYRIDATLLSYEKISHEATAMLQYRFAKANLNINSFYKYVGRTPRLSMAITGEAIYNGFLAPYSTWDVSAEKRLFKNKVQLIAGIKNLLDIQTVRVSGSTSGGVHASGAAAGASNISPGRSFFTSLRINLD